MLVRNYEQPKYIVRYYSYKNELKSIVAELNIYQDKRVTILFEEEKTKLLNKKIKFLSYQLREELKSIEKKINIYINSKFFKNENDLLLQIKENISQRLISELNSFSKKYKIN